jgi:dihydroorotase-like cyclic amidohydrolase
VDVGFYGGIIPGNADQLLPLVEAGVRGFKGFLIASGVRPSSLRTPAVDLQIGICAMND